MAIKYYEELIECLSTDKLPNNTPDEYGLRFTDTGETFKRHLGEWVRMELGYSYPLPTKSGVVTTDNNGDANIIFGTPFVDDAYTIALSGTIKGNKYPVVNWVTKDKNGFTLHASNSTNGKKIADVSVSWLCTRNFNK